MKKQVKIILAALFVSVLVFVTILFNNQAIAIDTITVSAEKATQYFTEKGVVEYENLASIYSLVSGKVVKYNVVEGQEIKEGDVICTIDTKDIEYQLNELNSQILSLNEQKNNLDSIRAKEIDALKQQKNSLLSQLDVLNAQQNTSNVSIETQSSLQELIISQNERDIERTKSDLDKNKLLYEQGIISKEELKRYETALNQLQLQLEQNIEQKSLIKSGNSQNSTEFYDTSKKLIEQQIYDLNQVINKDYNHSMKKFYDAQILGVEVSIERLNNIKNNGEIVSTVSGVVESLPLKDNNIIAQTQAVALIGTGEPVVVTYVATNDINCIAIGDEVTLVLKRRMEDEIYTGKIVSIEDKAEIKLSTLGTEERKIKVEIKPSTGEESFKIGFDTDVKFLAFQQDEALIVPKTAVFQENKVTKLWKVSNGIINKVEITEGMKINNSVIINSGINSGDIIVRDATLKELKEGKKVKN